MLFHKLGRTLPGPFELVARLEPLPKFAPQFSSLAGTLGDHTKLACMGATEARSVNTWLCVVLGRAKGPSVTAWTVWNEIPAGKRLSARRSNLAQLMSPTSGPAQASAGTGRCCLQFEILPELLLTITIHHPIKVS